MNIRSATPADARGMLDIYAPYVRDTAISFEYVPPTLDEFRRRIERTTARYPWLLAEENGRVLGYAYAGALKALGVTNLYACVAWPEVEDEYLTGNSVRFHAHMGFVECAHFHKCGCKFGRWYDMIWMEKLIGTHDENARPPFAG